MIQLLNKGNFERVREKPKALTQIMNRCSGVAFLVYFVVLGFIFNNSLVIIREFTSFSNVGGNPAV